MELIEAASFAASLHEVEDDDLIVKTVTQQDFHSVVMEYGTPASRVAFLYADEPAHDQGQNPPGRLSKRVDSYRKLDELFGYKNHVVP